MIHTGLCVCELHRGNRVDGTVANHQNHKKAACVCPHTHGLFATLPYYYSPTLVPNQPTNQQVWYYCRLHSEVTGYV